MTGADFDHFCRMVRERSGLALGPDKSYLIKARLEPIARAEGLPGFEALLERLARGAPEPLQQRCVEALATHESSFFRDGAPFELLKTMVLPQLAADRRPMQPLRIWCAACSSGQEPYSISIILRELGQALGGRRVEITATDFSPQILAKAETGLYSDFEVRRGLSPERLKAWFTPEPGGWRASPELRQMVRFRQHNLLSGPFDAEPFDIVFCRNVLIYFDPPRKQQVLAALAGAMAPDGWLFLGAAESLMGLPPTLAAAEAARGLCRRVALRAA